MRYIEYNREERDICAHLFRLLLENQPAWPALKDFLGLAEIENPRIFCEAALLRDAYFVRKNNPNLADFMNNICEEIAKQEGIKKFTRFYVKSFNIHPRQIRYYIDKSKKETTKEDKTVYKSLQEMFNAKPDIVICHNDQLLIYEAKYTEPFDKKQFTLTEKIGQIWAECLYQDLGFSTKPHLKVKKIGLGLSPPDVSWEQIYDIAKKYWQKDDFSLRVLAKVKDRRGN